MMNAGSAGNEACDNLFIAGLPQELSEDQVRAIFAPYGTVLQCKLLPSAGKPDQAALVRFGAVEQAQWLVQNVNGNAPVGLTSPLTIRYADNRAQKAKELGLPHPGTIGFGQPGMGGMGGMPSAAPVASSAGAYGQMSIQMPHTAHTDTAATPATGMMTGSVKCWYEEKGFGFLVPDNGGQDVFVHRTGLLDGQSLMTGGKVTFEAAWDQMKNKYLASKVSGAIGGAPGVAPVQAAVQEATDNLFIAGLAQDVTEERLRQVLGQYGAIAQAKVLPANDKADRAALVRMCDTAQAQWIVQNLNGNIPQGFTTPIVVRFAENKALKQRAGIPVQQFGQPSGFGPMAGAPQAASRFSPYGDSAAAANPGGAGLSDAVLMAAMTQLGQGPGQAAPAEQQQQQQFQQAQMPQYDMNQFAGAGGNWAPPPAQNMSGWGPAL